MFAVFNDFVLVLTLLAYLILYSFPPSLLPDLSCVSCMPYLLELNASQNQLKTFFNFKPPKKSQGRFY